MKNIKKKVITMAMTAILITMVNFNTMSKRIPQCPDNLPPTTLKCPVGVDVYCCFIVIDGQVIVFLKAIE